MGMVMRSVFSKDGMDTSRSGSKRWDSTRTECRSK